MPNYPPPPFPPPYLANLSYATDGSANLLGLSQHAGQHAGQHADQHPPATSAKDDSHINGGIYAQLTNAYSFQTNQQGNDGISNVNGYLAPSLTGLENDGSHLPLPPPDTSRGYFPYSHLSQDQITSQQHISNPSFNSQNQETAQSEAVRFGPDDGIPQPTLQGIALPTVSGPELSDLEDGELSDGDVNGNREDIGPLDRFSAQRPSHASDITLRETLIHVNNRSETVPAHHLGIYDIPFTVTVENTDSLLILGTEAAHRTGMAKSISKETSEDQKTNMHADGQPHRRIEENKKRLEAIRALKLLHSHGIDFLQLVDKGHNPWALEEFYAEIGIQPPHKDLVAAKAMMADKARVTSYNTREAQNSNDIPKSHNKADENERQPPQKYITTGVGLPKPRKHGLNTPDPIIDYSESQMLTSDAAEVPALSLENMTSVNKSSNVSAKTIDKGYDRKDHIARLLAAKTGKTNSAGSLPASNSPAQGPAPVSRPSDFQQPSASVGNSTDMARETQKLTSNLTEPQGSEFIGTSALQQDLAAPVLSVVIPGIEKPVSLPDPTPVASDPVLQAEKKRTQTELARQRIEALKIASNKSGQKAQTRVPRTSHPQANPSSGAPQHQAATFAASGAPPTPRSSYFSPTPGRQFSLPGLFMPPALQMPQNNEPAVPQSVQGIAAPPDPQQQAVEIAPEPNLPANPPLAPSSSLNPALIISTKPQIGSINTEIVNMKKRQKAADFIDAPSARVKRPFGQSGDSSVVIEVSDDEARDDSVDDMELSIVNDQQRSHATLGKVSDMQAVQDRTAPDPKRQIGGSLFSHQYPGTTPMTPPLSGVISNDNNGLRSKEIEIETMKRKIAEREQRRKAKQSASRAQTPISSKVSNSPKQNQAPSDMIGYLQDSPATGSSQAKPKNQNESDDTTISARIKALSGQEHLLAEQQVAETEVELASQLKGPASPSNQSQQRQHSRGDDDREVQSLNAADLPGTRSTPFEAEQHQEVKHQLAIHPRDLERNQQEARAPSEALPKSQVQSTGVISNDEQNPRISQRSEEECKMRRKAAIEAELPIFDLETENTERKIQSLQSQIRELEIEYNQKLQGKRHLVEELRTLSLGLATSYGGTNFQDHDGSHDTMENGKAN